MRPINLLKRATRAPFAWGALVLAGIVGGGLAISAYRASQNNSGLVVDPGELDFGSVWESPAYSLPITLHNPGDQPVEIAEWQVSCNCTKVSPPALVIPSGESREIQLTLNLASAFEDGSTANSAAFSVQLVPVIPAAPRGPGWEVTGFVERPILFRPERLEVRIEDESPLVVDVRTQLPIDARRIGASSSLFASAILEEAGSPRRLRLTLVPKSNLPPGVHPTEIVLRPAATAAGASPARLPVRLTVPGPISVTPKEVSFGAISPGAREVETLLLTARDSDQAVRIVDIRHGAGVACVCATTDESLARHEIEITALYNIAGLHRGAVEIIAASVDGKNITVRIPVRGYLLSVPKSGSEKPPTRKSAPVQAPKPG